MVNKKGQVVVELRDLILAIIVLVALGGVVIVIQDPAIVWVKENACLAAVNFKSATFVGGVQAFPYDIGDNCPTIIRQVRQDDLYKTISNEIQSCWRKTSAGDNDLVNSYSTSERTETFCIICSQIEPKNKNDVLVVEPNTLNSYLNEIEINGRKGILSGLTNTENTLDWQLDSNLEITRTEPLYVAYYIFKSDKEFSGGITDTTKGFFSQIFGGAAGVATLTKVARVPGSEAISLSFRTSPVAWLGAIAIGAGIDYAYKDNTVHGIVIGPGSQVAEVCGNRQL